MADPHSRFLKGKTSTQTFHNIFSVGGFQSFILKNVFENQNLCSPFEEMWVLTMTPSFTMCLRGSIKEVGSTVRMFFTYQVSPQCSADARIEIFFSPEHYILSHQKAKYFFSFLDHYTHNFSKVTFQDLCSNKDPTLHRIGKPMTCFS